MHENFLTKELTKRAKFYAIIMSDNTIMITLQFNHENDKVILSDTIMKNDELKQYIEVHKDYVVCGNANHLGIEGKESNVLSEMISLIDYITPTDNSLGATPIYMKD